jgi:hypothetical protein
VQLDVGGDEEYVSLAPPCVFRRPPFLRDDSPDSLHKTNAPAVSPGSEIKIAGPLNFHDLARVIAAGSTLIAVVLSLYLIFMHATHYTQPKEQRQ